MKQNCETLDRRKRKTRQAIQKSLMELMTEKSIDTISITELSERADINRKTFYNNYSSIEEVKRELEQFYIDDLFNLLNDVIQISTDNKEIATDQNLKNFLHMLIYRLSSDPVQAKLIFTSGESLYLMDQIKHFLEPYISQAQKVIDVNVNKVNFFMEYIVNGTFATLNAWVKGVYPILPEDLETLLYNMIQANLKVPVPYMPDTQL